MRRFANDGSFAAVRFGRKFAEEAAREVFRFSHGDRVTLIEQAIHFSEQRRLQGFEGHWLHVTLRGVVTLLVIPEVEIGKKYTLRFAAALAISAQ